MQSIEMTIRRATRGDRAHMLELWERSVRATHDFLRETDIETLRPAVSVELAATATDWWIAAGGHDAALGFLGYSPGIIGGLFVDPAHRGHGVGSGLVAHAQTLAAGSLRVDVNEHNPQARGFYEALGFEVVGRSPTDDAGRPFPILHMIRAAPGS